MFYENKVTRRLDALEHVLKPIENRPHKGGKHGRLHRRSFNASGHKFLNRTRHNLLSHNRSRHLDWMLIPIPTTSHFPWFNAPNDTEKWLAACLKAKKGEQVIIKKIFNQIISPHQFHTADKAYHWVNDLVDVQLGI